MIMYLIVIMIYVGRIDINAFIMSNSFLFEIRDKLFHTSLEEFKHYVNHSKISIDAKTAESLFTAIYNKHTKNYTKTWIEYFAYFAE